MDRIGMTCDWPVAVIDDDAMMRDSLRVLLATANIQARTFATAEDFLGAHDLVRTGCVLLDVRLPGMNGLELLQRVREAPHGGPPVVVITGHGDVPMAVAAMRAGAFHFVEKPFDPEALLAITQEALQRADKIADAQSRRETLAAREQSLTPRERQVLELLVEGLPSKLIAYELGVSTRTAEHHRSAVMRKMEARTLSHLVRMALDLRSVTNTSAPSSKVPR
jgi:two-component system response regulator FixJ